MSRVLSAPDFARHRQPGGEMKMVIDNGVEEDMLSVVIPFTGMPA